MLATAKPLAALTAADLMSRDVVIIPNHWSLQRAAQVLARARVGGAPVVDAGGRCVGVLSATDFLHRAQEDPGPVCSRPSSCVCADWQMVGLDLLPPDAVAASMTADPVTARPMTPLRELARMMLDAHIHRIVIVDEGDHPVGIVSSTDVLAAVARLEEE